MSKSPLISGPKQCLADLEEAGHGDSQLGSFDPVELDRLPEHTATTVGRCTRLDEKVP